MKKPILLLSIFTSLLATDDDLTDNNNHAPTQNRNLMPGKKQKHESHSKQTLPCSH